MSSSTPSTKSCFNPGCKDPKSDRFRRGWRLRNGDFAELCDRCATAYEEGRFCEQFHMKSAGWRSCQCCGKLLHCGCISSVNAHVLLDVGGVECVTCARKHSILATNPVQATNPSWSLSSLPQSERFKDISTKNWNPVAVPNGAGGQWWHTANARNIVSSQSRLPYELDRSNATDKLISTERPPVSGLERVLEDPSGRGEPSNHNLSVDRISSRNAGADMVVGLSAFRREEGTLDVLQDSCHLPGENGLVDARKGLITEPGLNASAAVMSFDAHSNSGLNILLQSSTAKDPLVPQHSKLVPYTPSSETNGSTSVSGTQTPPVPLSKQFNSDSQNGADSSAETQMRNGKARGDARGRPRLLPRYWPKITDQELQQISGDSSLVVTPLFEKTLSASDAGRIGRLVLPKKCAEQHLPTISQPEGVPLRVQDAKGKEWVFQFRFWPNNNSRMYVLEGVTPCIQNMQLQAGDTVTFSRMDPDGKLVMGFRKTSISPPSNQDNPKLKIANGASKHAEANLKEANTWSEAEKSGYIAKDALRAKSDLLPSKKKSSALGLRSKRLQIDNEDLIELQLTWEEAQGLLRPPPNLVPIVVVVEGRAFEEYEEPPTLGRPTIFTTNDFGEIIQWAQCEECYKWRKLPVDVLLHSQWTCSDNSWDAKRSSCSSDQELTDGQLQDLLLDSSNNVASKKNKSAKKDSDTAGQSEGLDTLANLAIMGEADPLPPSAQPPTTKHPRHRAGCTCIVCIQPPSGKGPKHSDSCICNVCMTVRRRFRTLMERRGKRPPENETGSTSRKKQHKAEKPPQQVEDVPTSSKAIDGDDGNNNNNPCSPFKGRIDLNIQPEREDDSSPVSSSSIILRFLRDPSEVQHKQQRLASSSTNGGGSEVGGDKIGNGNGVSNSCDQDDADMDRNVPLSAWIPDTSATG